MLYYRAVIKVELVMASDQSVEQQAPGGELEAEHQEQPKTPVSISLDLFQSVRQAQSQHGLRHNDYKRYRYVPDSYTGHPIL